jgi:hypothetical protein
LAFFGTTNPDGLWRFRAIRLEQRLPLVSVKKADPIETAAKGQVPSPEEAHARAILSKEGHVAGPEGKWPPFTLSRRIFRQHVRLLIYSSFLIDSEVTEVIFNQLHVGSALAKTEHQRSEVLISN